MREWLLSEGRIGLLILALPVIVGGMLVQVRAMREPDRVMGYAGLLTAVTLIGFGVYIAMIAIHPKPEPEPWDIDVIYGKKTPDAE